MRIIAGSARGRPLEGPGPRAQGIRPTSDKVRGAIFNILGQWMDGLAVLDLYAGTGAMALEALSRGASSAALVDPAAEAVELCRRNADKTGFGDKVEILRTTAERACERLGREGRRFELAFADPPYSQHAGAEVVALVGRTGVLAPGGVLVVEHDAREEISLEAGDPRGLRRTDLRKFGGTAVSFFSLS